MILVPCVLNKWTQPHASDSQECGEDLDKQNSTIPHLQKYKYCCQKSRAGIPGPWLNRKHDSEGEVSSRNKSLLLAADVG